MATYKEDAKLNIALNSMLPPEAADALYQALGDWMRAHKEDLYDRVNKSGEWDPDY